ncbi:MAG: 2,3-bisphosphoglycerate-dependent phosphoglycerate mutase [Proteobacteria bacterium]|nr:2,3-bisphosphoglycerate-dependent phosphoglycerate mutase [Pseudomonadota bacterium]
MSDAQLTLLRHGKSVWNQENRFTGWVDVDLAEAGRQEAAAAAAAMKQAGLHFNAAYASHLKRALATLWVVLEEMELMWLPQCSDWRLNERHYGALQGLDKTETTQKYGEEQVRQWRRSYAMPPPPTTEAYTTAAGIVAPASESLKDIIPRVQEVYQQRIVPLLQQQQSVLIVAHGNSLRALMKIIEGISDEAIMQVEVPTATPHCYRLDSKLQCVDKTILNRN